MTEQNSTVPTGSSGEQNPPRVRPREGAETVKAISELLGQQVEAGEDSETDEKSASDGGEETPGNVLEGHSSDERGDDQGEAEEDSSARSKPRTLQEAAEALGMEASELYDLDVGLGDGTTIKLGELKDQHARRGELDRETVKRQRVISEQEAALEAGRLRLSEVSDMLRGTLSPGMEQAVTQALEREGQLVQDRERRHLDQAWPELQERKQAAAVEEFLGEVLSKRGIGRAEFQKLVRGNHKLMLLCRDWLEDRKQLAFLMQEPKAKDPPRVMAPQGRGGPGGDDAVSRAKRTRNEGDIRRGVSSILRGSR